MVDDDDVGMPRRLARPHLVTALRPEKVAGFHDAVEGIGIDFAPERILGHEIQLGAITAARVVGPAK